MPTTWSEHLTRQGYTDTIGQYHDPATGLLVKTKPGRFNSSAALIPGEPDSLGARYGQPGEAGPLFEEASFKDPRVLDEYAKAMGLDLYPATDTDREDIRWVTQPHSEVTFYQGVINPFTLNRDKPEEPTDGGPDFKALQDQVNDQERRLKALEEAVSPFKAADPRVVPVDVVPVRHDHKGQRKS